MDETFCIFCGSTKVNFKEACPACGETPRTAQDLAKSLILCGEFQLDAAELPLTEEQIAESVDRIRSGDREVFLPSQVAMVASYYTKELHSPRAIILGLVYFFGPLVLGGGFLLWYFLS